MYFLSIPIFVSLFLFRSVQDPLGIQGHRVVKTYPGRKGEGAEVWIDKLVDGIAVLLFNRADHEQVITAKVCGCAAGSLLSAFFPSVLFQ